MKGVAAAALIAGVLQLPAGRPPAFETDVKVDVVSLDVSVMRDGAAVRGLTADDFTVLDDGVPQSVRSAVLLEGVPLDVQLVLDTSGSLKGDRLKRLNDAAATLLRSLRQDDRAGLITFSEAVRVRSALTADTEAVAGALKDLSGEGRSAIRDAVEVGLSLQRPGGGRPLMILLTDGIDNASWLTDEDLIASLRQADVVTHVVRIPTMPFVPTPLAGNVAERTGGRVWDAQSDRDLERLFKGALEEMRARYLLTFTPKSPARTGWHPLDVRVRRGGADVTARPGYVAGRVQQ